MVRHSLDEEAHTDSSGPSDISETSSRTTTGLPAPEQLAGSTDMSPAARTPFGIPGQLIILSVALLWGSNPPALRFLYASEGNVSEVSYKRHGKACTKQKGFLTMSIVAGCVDFPDM